MGQGHKGHPVCQERPGQGLWILNRKEGCSERPAQGRREGRGTLTQSLPSPSAGVSRQGARGPEEGEEADRFGVEGGGCPRVMGVWSLGPGRSGTIWDRAGLTETPWR